MFSPFRVGNDPSDITLTGYQYRYRNTSDTGWNPDWTGIPGSRWTTTSYTVTGLSNRTGYTFEIRALRGSRRGPSATASATPEGPPTVPLAPGNLNADGNDRSIEVRWQWPAVEDARAPVTSNSVRYRQTGTSSWHNVPHANDADSGRQVISELANRTHYEVQVAAVNRVGTGAWASAKATPQAPSAPPPGPTGDDAFNLGPLGLYWDHTDAEGGGNLLQTESCTGTQGFLVIWAGPDQDDRRADEWAVHINTLEGAGEVIYSIRESPSKPGYFEMNGTMNFEGSGTVYLSVRGRYVSTWGTWSPVGALYCYES